MAELKEEIEMLFELYEKVNDDEIKKEFEEIFKKYGEFREYVHETMRRITEKLQQLE